MKKNNIKPLVMSALAAMAMAGVGIGGTFALFTDKAETQVTVESGIVDVDQELAIQEVYELGNQEVAASAGTYTNSIGGKTYIDSENGNLLHLEKWAPGDKAVLTLTNKNLSNVTIKTRFTYSHTSTSDPDLYEALNISYGFTAGYSESITASNYKLWTSLAPASTADNVFSKVTITIEFPDQDNGEILFGDANKDNKYQNSDCTILFRQEAVQGNAETDDILNQINFKLEDEAVLEGKNPTMYDALEDLTPYLVGKIEERDYVWSVENDQFYDFSAAPEKAYEYFKMYEAMPVNQTYSIYAIGDGWETVNNLTVGFDAGSSGANSITYDRSGAENGRSVVIRTNGGNLTINAPKDVVKHYGDADALNIIAVAGSSYHEYGNVPFAEISKGRIALENGANVAVVHINSIKDEYEVTTNQFDEIVISLADAVETPTFSRDEVEIASTGTLVVAIQNGTEEVTEDTELDYIWLTKLGIFEQIKVSDNKETMEDAVWADDVSLDDSSTQGAALDIANNIGRADPTDNKSDIKVELEITKDDETKTYKVVLDENRDLVVVDKADSEETPIATLNDEKGNVQIGEAQFEIALKSTEDEIAQLVATNVDDSEEVYTAEAVVEAGLDQEAKEESKKEAKFKAFIDAGYYFVVGNTGYKTLKEAFAAVEDNQTIEMIQDLNFTVGADDIDNNLINYWHGTGFKLNHRVKSYIHLDSKKNIVFNMNGFAMNVDYSLSFLDIYQTTEDRIADKVFIFLSGEGSLKITNGTMNVKFDYKNRASTANGSSVYNESATYSAIYVHNSPENPGTSNSDAVYDIPYQTELSMIDCSLTANQIPLRLHQGAHVTDLNAHIRYFIEGLDIVNDGKSANIYEGSIQTANSHCVYMEAGSKIDKISGGSYTFFDQRLIDKPTTFSPYFQPNGDALRLLGGYQVKATFNPQPYPNVYVPNAEIAEISGGTFKSNMKRVVEIYGKIDKISGGYFSHFESTYANRNTKYQPPMFYLDNPSGYSVLGTITGGTFVADYHDSRADGSNNIFELAMGSSASVTYPAISNYVGDGYIAIVDESASRDLVISSTSTVRCYAYKVVAAN